MLIEILAAMAVASGGDASAAQDSQTRVAPRGSYRDSCRGAYVNRGRLYAECATSRGRFHATSIDLDRCANHEIGNNEGLLVCGPNRGEFEDRPGGGRPDRPGQGGGHGGGQGGARGEITVYRDADFRGADFTFRGEMPNLRNTEFNDVISSMRFRGAWEVCTDAYFRGTCRTFNDDVTNLSAFGLNDRVSSLRPVRR